MKFADELVAQLEAFAEAGPVPRVRAIHLPPKPAEDDCRGEFFALELEDGAIGLSYVLLDRTLEQLSGGIRYDPRGADALEVARAYANKQGVERTLGFAAANALTRCLYDRSGYVAPASADSFGGIEPVAGDHIGMIGLFKPLLERVRAGGARLTVVELKPELAGQRDGYLVTLDRARLNDCNKVVSTSTLLLNDTLDEMLAACRGAARFALIGPSAGCLPDALFERGVTSLGGSWIVDRHGFLDALKAGASRSRFTRKYAVVAAAGYPGFPELLGRIAGAGRARP